MEKNLPICPWFYFYCSQYLASIYFMWEEKEKKGKGEKGKKEKKRIYVSCPHGVLM